MRLSASLVNDADKRILAYHYQFIRLFLGSLLVPCQDAFHHLPIQDSLAICEHLERLAQEVQSSSSLTVCFLIYPILLQQHQAIVVQGTRIFQAHTASPTG